VANAEDADGGVIGQMVGYELLRLAYGVDRIIFLTCLAGHEQSREDRALDTQHHTTQLYDLDNIIKFFSLVVRVVITATIFDTATTGDWRSRVGALTIEDLLGGYCEYSQMTQQTGEEGTKDIAWVLQACVTSNIVYELLPTYILRLLNVKKSHTTASSDTECLKQ
jgi:hypothetical protein